MKKRFLSLIGSLTFGLIISMGLTSCEPDTIVNEIHQGTEIKTEFLTVYVDHKGNDWSWNSIYKRYECVFSYPAITKKIYEKGLVQAGVFVLENGIDNTGRPITYETLKSMPYVQSYNFNGRAYTATTGYDISIGYITFYIQESDLSSISDYLITTEFKVSILYDPNK